jgi:toxin CptA
MSSNSFVNTVDLSPHPSMRAFRWLFLLHTGLLLLTAFAMPPGVMFFALITLLALSWLWLRRHPAFGFGPRAIVRMIWHAEGQWTLYEGNGHSFEAELMPDSILHATLLVLNFKQVGGGRKIRILLGDELDEESLRRLRARLLATH